MKPRGRPKKLRVVNTRPRINQFSPRGKPGRPDEVELSMDELEALCLADFKSLRQKAGAESMGISQQTFSRILKKAHKILADALVNGKIIKIQGGRYVISSHKKIRDGKTK